MKANYFCLLVIFLWCKSFAQSQSNYEKEVEQKIRQNTLNNLHRYEGISFHYHLKIGSDKKIDTTEVINLISSSTLFVEKKIFLESIDIINDISLIVNIYSDENISIGNLKESISFNPLVIIDSWQEKRLK